MVVGVDQTWKHDVTGEVDHFICSVWHIIDLSDGLDPAIARK